MPKFFVRAKFAIEAETKAEARQKSYSALGALGNGVRFVEVAEVYACGLSPEEENELAQLEVEFEGSGGRGVELAEQIDALRKKRDGVEVCWECGEELTYKDNAGGRCLSCGAMLK